jgi:hypothetical protein
MRRVFIDCLIIPYHFDRSCEPFVFFCDFFNPEKYQKLLILT